VFVCEQDFYPQGEKVEGLEEGDEEEEDAAAIARREKAEKKKAFDDLIKTLSRQGTLSPKEAKKLTETFKAVQGKGKEIEQAFDLYMKSPSDAVYMYICMYIYLYMYMYVYIYMYI